MHDSLAKVEHVFTTYEMFIFFLFFCVEVINTGTTLVYFFEVVLKNKY